MDIRYRPRRARPAAAQIFEAVDALVGAGDAEHAAELDVRTIETRRPGMQQDNWNVFVAASEAGPVAQVYVEAREVRSYRACATSNLAR